VKTPTVLTDEQLVGMSNKVYLGITNCTLGLMDRSIGERLVRAELIRRGLDG